MVIDLKSMVNAMLFSPIETFQSEWNIANFLKLNYI